MISFTRIVLRLAQIVVGLIFIYSLTMLLLNNEPFKIFKFEKSYGDVIKIIKKEKDTYLVTYQYKVNDHYIISKVHLTKNLLYNNDKVVDFIIIYNKIFPSINRINNFTLYNGYYVGLIWGFVMLTIFISIDLFADKEKWAERYSRFFGLK
ncbi:MAG: hypothetical protein A4E59_00256 [Syntrophorhabdus sp. PtaB.Bin027]|nr:MAG: hypothetical protein A4E59_00256 [Syntrophorhabdus sp. PtaB.Bin027]